MAEIDAAGAIQKWRASVAKLRILVVDDNRDAADVMATLLQYDGPEVEAVYSSREALAVLPGFQLDIALLDIGLPEIDDYELARRIRAGPALQRMRLIAIAGYGQEEDKARAFAAGFAAHLLKPVEFERLQQLIGESGERSRGFVRPISEHGRLTLSRSSPVARSDARTTLCATMAGSARFAIRVALRLGYPAVD